MYKRLISFLLVLCLFAGLLPLCYAEEAAAEDLLTPVEEIEEQETDAEETPAPSEEDTQAALYKEARALLGQKKFEEARKLFKKLNDYKKSEGYLNVCKAEIALANGEFRKAYKAYDKVSKKLKVDGFDIQARRKLVLKYKAFASISGKWQSSKYYIESRQIHDRTGIWNSWYINSGIAKSQTLTIRCYLQSNGKMRIEGNVSFYKYDNFSILSAYCNAHYTSRSFTVKNLTKVPSSIKVASHTKLKLSGSTFTLKYSEKEYESVYFTNRYRSTVTYGKRLDRY